MPGGLLLMKPADVVCQLPFVSLSKRQRIRTLSNKVNNTDWELPSHSAHHVELMKLCTATDSLNSLLTTPVTAVCCTMPDIAFAQTHMGIHTQVSQLTVLGASTRTCVPHVCINLFQNFRLDNLHPIPLLHFLFLVCGRCSSCIISFICLLRNLSSPQCMRRLYNCISLATCTGVCAGSSMCITEHTCILLSTPILTG